MADDGLRCSICGAPGGAYMDSPERGSRRICRTCMTRAATRAEFLRHVHLNEHPINAPVADCRYCEVKRK